MRQRHSVIVLVILFFLEEPRPQYALLQLDFLDVRNFEHYLLVPSNAGGLMISAKELRLFWGSDTMKTLEISSSNFHMSWVATPLSRSMPGSPRLKRMPLYIP